ncbi:uncharacterized protein LOC112514072 isoform X1 [Cynara cardunculus var. scolymus]|uniref:uncharacterized protein LOC112514072 isoform X1 n=1 Tax=Cynara cardunculus var. scolymus TaxID=59895 RepID=UPI000D629ECD|nr:uncharacterized protein LOC112514072 isoform X1 [Cynara cardunculus var. scolymus]XP_024976162.1 uncharacterized protein LOC112514072 isoform X1 [Cynara cardunculus var. scolymus]XP_024976163.1 uncharacterized protein LOC112514072 isoform X1 [Cynara cardunculus var. scolymus]XP_024976164.1 uncharacterized protein LOC112514072 isoform X1 [Cynara cardunculus var. scolymus]XP_024976165.1 uncharacterized protein LOC112514072 isoform X1 [Cynara cardunculus var. scolymus]XP_024976166.1 uncharacte
MPGNGVGDRVHNFFAQDNLSQVPRSRVGDGNWSLNDNLWVGSQKQFGGSDSNPRNYNPQQSETERGHDSQRVPDPHIFNIAQTSSRPEFARSLSHREQANSNGYMYGRQNFQTRPDEANFLGVDTEYGRNNASQRGFSFCESQQEAGSEQTPKDPFRSETSEAHGSFDLFGGQHQMNSQYPGSMQPLQQQQSGFGDIQQLQQQLMLRKMQELQRQELQRQDLHRQDLQRQELQRQELQRQEDLRQLEARQQNSLNQASSFARQASGSHPHGLVNGTPTSDSSGYAWNELAAGNTNWLQRASPAMQGSSSGLAFSPEQGQPQRSMGFVQQQVDQSLYGVPVSSSRGPLNQYPHIATDKASVQQLPSYNNSFPGNHYAVIPEQLTVQDGASVNRQGLPGKSLFGNTSGQGPSSGTRVEHIQQLKAPQSTSVQESHVAHDLIGSTEMVQDKSATEVTSSHGAASLDPDEEKILFGSDDNIWDAFGSSKNMGGVSSLLDDNEFGSGLPSLQSGSWSALMQSAVAETSTDGAGLQEEWPDLNFQSPELPSGEQPSTYEESGKHQKALSGINLPNASALTFGSVALADGANMNDKQRSNLGFPHHGKNNSYEDDERPNINYSKLMNQHSSGGSNWLNRGALEKVGVEDSQLYENSANTGFNINEKDNSLQQSQNNDWKRVMHDETGQGGRISSVNPMLHPSVEREPVNREGLAASNTAVIPNLSNLQGGSHSNQFSPNNHHLNYWKHVDSSVKSKGSENSEKSQRRLNKGPQVSESSFNSSDKEDLKTHEMESSSRRENSNDSYRSGSSHLPNTVGPRERFSSDAGDSRSLPGMQQSLSNQAGRMTSGPRKFQYHPMGNLDEDAGMPYGARQSMNTRAMPLQHSRGLGGQDQGNYVHTKTSGQGYVPELEGVPKGSDDMRFKGMIPGHVSNIFAPHDRSVGLSTSDKASQPSQNMLELLHKVDQSGERGIARHLNSLERNLSSEIPEPENSDGSFGGHQRSQSSNSQGIGLQLGPPSQRLPLPNHASPRAIQTIKPNSLSQAQASANPRGKGLAEMSPFPPFQDTSHGEFKNDRVKAQSASETSGHKMMNNFSAALGTDFPNSRSQPQNHQMIGARGQALTNRSGNESLNGHSPQIRQADETRGRSLSSGLYDNAVASERVQASQPSTGEKLPASQPHTNSGISQPGAFPKMLPNAWGNLPTQQLLSASQPRKGPSNLSPSHQLNIVESTSLGQQNLEQQEAEKRGNSLSKYGASSLNSQGFTSVGEQQSAKESPSLNLSSEKVDRAQMMNGPAGNDSINMPFSDASSLNPAASQRDLEAFGRSLKPNNLHQNSSILNQMKAMRNTEIDPNNRALKRLKDSDNNLGGQQVAPWSGKPRELKNMVGDSSICHTTASPGDSEMPRFTGPTDNVMQNVASLPANLLSKDVLASDQSGSQSCIPSNNMNSGEIEHSHISPQMAPSWFDQYGTFKSGQMLSQRADAVRTLEQPLGIGKVYGSFETHNVKEEASAAADTSQAGVILKNPLPSSMAVEQFSSPPSQTNTSVQNLVTVRSKKRKCSPAELHPWLKEVSGGFKELQSICTASMEWSGATNRLMEKVEDDGEVIEDAHPMPRPKRRIILTTQLMQQLFPAPPATVLSTDSTSSYGSVAFHAARLALGDACNLVSSVRSHSSISHSGSNSLSDKSRESEKNDDRLLEVVEDHMSKVRRLENDFSRLDKSASILDLRVEFQDLEKFSIINRFARFHGRAVQTDGGSAEASSSNAAAANTPKIYPQRYVIAVPLPKNLPERVQCLSL